RAASTAPRARLLPIPSDGSPGTRGCWRSSSRGSPAYARTPGPRDREGDRCFSLDLGLRGGPSTASGELRAHRNLRIQEPRDRTILFRAFRRGLELARVRAGGLRRNVQMDRLDRPSLVRPVEVQGRFRLDHLGTVSRLAEFI